MFHLTFVMIMWYAVLYVFISDTTRSCVKMLKEVSMPVKLKEIMLSQLENMGRRRNGKRYTPLVYKICMLLFHYSRSCYAALRGIFMLPSPRGLRLHLRTLFPKASDVLRWGLFRSQLGLGRVLDITPDRCPPLVVTLSPMYLSNLQPGFCAATKEALARRMSNACVKPQEK